MTSETQAIPAGIPPVDPTLLGKGLAALRIFVGVIAFSNGLAKLFSFRDIEVGPYAGNLIDRPLTKQILDIETNKTNGGEGTELPLLPSIVNDFIIPNFGWLQWVITFVELGVGALLIVGLASRGAALVGLGQQLFIAALYFSSNRFVFEQPHEYVPLAILALVPAGRVWGLDARITRQSHARLGRWPF